MRIDVNAVSRWIDDEGGVTSIEYALIGMLIAVVIVSAVSALGTKMHDLYQTVASQIIAAVH
nr:Flp family type IVb pilin [Burkholderia guangdongensis]